MMPFYIDEAHVAGGREARPLFPNPCRSSKDLKKCQHQDRATVSILRSEEFVSFIERYHGEIQPRRRWIVISAVG